MEVTERGAPTEDLVGTGILEEAPAPEEEEPGALEEADEARM